MKLLPCERCRRPALATRDGVLQAAGQMLDPFLDYLCRRCGRLQRISSREFAQLPEMPIEILASNQSDLPFPTIDDIPLDERPGAARTKTE